MSTIKDVKPQRHNKMGLLSLIKRKLIGKSRNLMIFRNHHGGKEMITARKISG